MVLGNTAVNTPLANVTVKSSLAWTLATLQVIAPLQTAAVVRFVTALTLPEFGTCTADEEVESEMVGPAVAEQVVCRVKSRGIAPSTGKTLVNTTTGGPDRMESHLIWSTEIDGRHKETVKHASFRYFCVGRGQTRRVSESRLYPDPCNADSLLCIYMHISTGFTKKGCCAILNTQVSFS